MTHPVQTRGYAANFRTAPWHSTPVTRRKLGLVVLVAALGGCTGRSGSYELRYRDQQACYEVRAEGADPWRGVLRFDGHGGVSLEHGPASTQRRKVTWTDGLPTPAAPDAECRARARDRLEDVLALGFPRLPGPPTAAGLPWPGPTPTAACARAACVTGGPRATCAAAPWLEQIEAQEGSRLTIEGNFAVGEFIAHRTAVFDRERGRLLTAESTVETPDGGRSLRLTMCTRSGQGTPTTPQAS